MDPPGSEGGRSVAQGRARYKINKFLHTSCKYFESQSTAYVNLLEVRLSVSLSIMHSVY